MKVSAKFLTLLFLVGLTTFLDQFTKSIIRSQIMLGEKINVIPGLFDLIHLHNPGAAFGFLGGINPSIRSGLFLIIYTFLGAFVVSRLRVTSSKLEIVALSLLVGGAVGNAVDRFRNGFVTDFLDFHFASLHYPAFNLADTAICSAVGFLFLNEYFARKPQAKVQMTNTHSPELRL